MDDFEHGADPYMIDLLSDAAVDILWFPFIPLARAAGIHGGGPAEWLLFGANSILWGAVLYLLLTALWRRFTRSCPPSTA